MILFLNNVSTTHCHITHHTTLRCLRTRVKQALVLATPSVNVSSCDQFLRNIILFNDKNVSRLISKRFCKWVDSETSSLTVRSISVLKCFRSADIKACIKRRVTKCFNLRSFRTLHEEHFLYLTCFDFLKELFHVSPGLSKIQSNTVSNWLVSTSTGMNLFNSYQPDASLTVDNILEILVLSLMAEDVNTLSRFYHMALDDLETDGSLIRVQSKLYLNEDNVRCCLHYTDRCNRPVTLKRDTSSGVWEIIHIGVKVSVQCVVCTISDQRNVRLP